MAKADKTKKNGDRNTTSLSINKEDLEPFNELRAKETGRRGASVSQNEFINFLLSLYQVVADDSTILDKALEHILQAREVPPSVSKKWAGWDKAHQKEA